VNEQKTDNSRIDRQYSDEKAITAALERAARKALLLHKQTGHPIYVWENEQVVRREARNIKVDLVSAE